MFNKVSFAFLVHHYRLRLDESGSTVNGFAAILKMHTAKLNASTALRQQHFSIDSNAWFHIRQIGVCVMIVRSKSSHSFEKQSKISCIFAPYQ